MSKKSSCPGVKALLIIAFTIILAGAAIGVGFGVITLIRQILNIFLGLALMLAGA